MTRYIVVVAILVAGCVVLSLVSLTFMERHWEQVTRRLTQATARDMAAIVDLYEVSSSKEETARLLQLALDRFGLEVAVLPASSLPAPHAKPFFDLLDRALSEEVRANVRHPFWIDTVGRSRQIEVRIKLDHAILSFVAPRWRAYASNSHIFVIWMIGSWMMLVAAGYFITRPLMRASRAVTFVSDQRG